MVRKEDKGNMGNFLEWMLESSLLILLIFGIRKIFMGKIRYTAIYALWFVVLVRFLVPVNFIATPFSVGNLVSDKMSTQDTEPESIISVEQTKSSALPKSEPELQNVVSEEKVTFNHQTESAQSDVSDVQKPVSGWMNHLNLLWFIVSCTLFCLFAFSNMSLLRKMKKSRVLYGKRENVPIYFVSGIQNPCLYGLFRPAIYLPKALAEENKEELGQMITHEYVHYSHGDHIWAMFRILLVCVYWFHPFLWLAVFCSKKDAELACDESVISRLGERKRFSYGEMLVRMAAETRFGEFRYSLMPMSRQGKEMEKRIRAIGNRKKYPKWLAVPLVIVVAVTVGITCSAGIGPSAKEQKGGGYDTQKFQTESESMIFGMSKIVGAETCEKAFQRYIEVFTEAVNTGDGSKLSQVLDRDSEVYQQQYALVKNYYKRGIRERVMSCSVTSMKNVTPEMVEMDSNETIKVAYATAPEKLIRQNYRYTCEKINNSWIITKMEEIE